MLTIADETGKQVRRLDLDKSAGLRRIAWNLRGDPGAAAARPAHRADFGGRGGNQAPLVAPGRYRATLARAGRRQGHADRHSAVVLGAADRAEIVEPRIARITDNHLDPCSSV